MRNVAFSQLYPITRLFCLLLLAAYLMLVSSNPAQAQSYNVLYSFTGPTTDASWPMVLLQAPDGTLYGGSCYGGQSFGGAAFALLPNGKETILYNFLAGYGSCPDSFLSWNGELYGATGAGGFYGGGAIFKLNKNGDEVVLHSFPRGVGPQLYFSDGKGNFYGSGGGGSLGYGTVFKVASSGKVTILHNFGLDSPEGYSPESLVADNNGNIYGATFEGGDPNCKCGTLFKLDPAGDLTILHVFTGGSDGTQPIGLVRDDAGNLYGATISGGVTNVVCPNGCGVIYELTASGAYKILYGFAGTPDGISPFTIVRDQAGTLYGLTDEGGDTNCYHGWNGGIGCGVVFKLDATGKETILHSFAGVSDGSYPQSLILGSAGQLYGATESGGDPACTMWGSYIGCGTIFELTP